MSIIPRCHGRRVGRRSKSFGCRKLSTKQGLAAFVHSRPRRYNAFMECRQHISGPYGAQASGRTDSCTDEFHDPMSIEDLAARWRCSLRTARAKILAHGLGINPAGTWLVSRTRVREFEEAQRTGTLALTTISPAARSEESRDRVKLELAKLGILRSRRSVPNMQKGRVGTLRRAG